MRRSGGVIFRIMLARPNDYNLLPLYSLEDYNVRLWSLFGQYTHKIGDFDFLVGLRNDNHDQYKDALSYNAGVVWSPRSEWVLKLLYGTAYRTPYVKQLVGGAEPDLEEIETLNLQVSWKPTEKVNLTVGGFSSRIDNHLMEDPYAGPFRAKPSEDLRG